MRVTLVCCFMYVTFGSGIGRNGLSKQSMKCLYFVIIILVASSHFSCLTVLFIDPVSPKMASFLFLVTTSFDQT